MILQWVFTRQYGLILGGGYAAFLQNLLMSVLYIVMLVHRNSPEGQSLTIAVSKWTEHHPYHPLRHYGDQNNGRTEFPDAGHGTHHLRA